MSQRILTHLAKIEWQIGTAFSALGLVLTLAQYYRSQTNKWMNASDFEDGKISP